MSARDPDETGTDRYVDGVYDWGAGDLDEPDGGWDEHLLYDDTDHPGLEVVCVDDVCRATGGCGRFSERTCYRPLSARRGRPD